MAASQSQLGDMNLPTCHKPSFESALIALAHNAASAAARETTMKIKVVKKASNRKPSGYCDMHSSTNRR